MRRRSLLVLVAAVAALLLLAAPAGAGAAARPAARPAAAGHPVQQPDAPADDGTGGSADDDGATNGTVEPAPVDDIIPKPNSGREPTEAGDRGGALQALVFALIVVGVGVIVAMIVREARRNRRALS